MRNVFYLAAILCVAISIGSSLPAEPAQSQTSRGDGIFTPVISPVAAIDKTGRPFTIEVTQPEPSFATSMIAGKPTGDSYVIHFPTGDAGGACMYSGTGRYLIESTGNLTFQILADCGKLRRGYSYMICMLDATLRCTEAPWWYFKDRTYAITNQGVVINGSTVRPWRDAAEAPQELQAMAAKIKSMRERFASLKDSHVVHTRFISCRAYHPATKSYEIHEFATTCLVRSLCNGIPNVDTLRDGERIDWNSPVGSYVKQQGKTSDVSNWV
ncbi:MAG TPA: hypothetical protein VJW93_13715, partial [Candidatus Acidoferrales bacterium]|nr:hypothetical protein [Candidatus Acidoferrales bacterium]